MFLRLAEFFIWWGGGRGVQGVGFSSSTHVLIIVPASSSLTHTHAHLNFVLGGAALLLVLLGEEAAHLVNEVFEELQFYFST